MHELALALLDGPPLSAAETAAALASVDLTRIQVERPGRARDRRVLFPAADSATLARWLVDGPARERAEELLPAVAGSTLLVDHVERHAPQLLASALSNPNVSDWQVLDRCRDALLAGTYDEDRHGVGLYHRDGVELLRTVCSWAPFEPADRTQGHRFAYALAGTLRRPVSRQPLWPSLASIARSTADLPWLWRTLADTAAEKLLSSAGPKLLCGGLDPNGAQLRLFTDLVDRALTAATERRAEKDVPVGGNGEDGRRELLRKVAGMVQCAVRHEFDQTTDLWERLPQRVAPDAVWPRAAAALIVWLTQRTSCDPQTARLTRELTGRVLDNLASGTVAHHHLAPVVDEVCALLDPDSPAAATLARLISDRQRHDLHDWLSDGHAGLEGPAVAALLLFTSHRWRHRTTPAAVAAVEAAQSEVGIASLWYSMPEAGRHDPPSAQVAQTWLASRLLSVRMFALRSGVGLDTPQAWQVTDWTERRALVVPSVTERLSAGELATLALTNPKLDWAPGAGAGSHWVIGTVAMPTTLPDEVVQALPGAVRLWLTSGALPLEAISADAARMLLTGAAAPDPLWSAPRFASYAGFDLTDPADLATLLFGQGGWRHDRVVAALAAGTPLVGGDWDLVGADQLAEAVAHTSSDLAERLVRRTLEHTSLTAITALHDAGSYPTELYTLLLRWVATHCRLADLAAPDALIALGHTLTLLGADRARTLPLLLTLARDGSDLPLAELAETAARLATDAAA